MLSCDIIPYMMVLPNRIKRNPTWRRHAHWFVSSAESLHVAAKTKPKNQPAISQRTGENETTWRSSIRCIISSRKDKPLHSYLGRYIYISIDFMLRPTTPHTSGTTGRFVVFSLPIRFRLSWTLRSRCDGRILFKKYI